MLSSVFWWWRTKQSSFLYSRVLKGKLIFYYFCKRGNGTKEKQLVNKAASGTERRWVSFQNGKHPTMKQNHLRLSLNSCHCRQNAIWLAHTPQTAAPSIYYHGTSDDTGKAVTYCMGKRDWCTNRGEQFKLLAGLNSGGNIVLFIQVNTNPHVQASAHSHHPLHRTNLKVKDSREAAQRPVSCTFELTVMLLHCKVHKQKRFIYQL